MYVELRGKLLCSFLLIERKYLSRRKKKYIEGIIEKVNFPNMSEFTFEDRKVNFKSGIEMEVWFNTNINRQLRVRFSWLAVFVLTFTWFLHVILSKMLFIRLLIRSWPHEWCNKLLDEAIKEIENLYEGEVFIFKELFKGYVWNRIPRKDCTNVLVDVFEIF